MNARAEKFHGGSSPSAAAAVEKSTASLRSSLSEQLQQPEALASKFQEIVPCCYRKCPSGQFGNRHIENV
jgi:hypothetical protein